MNDSFKKSIIANHDLAREGHLKIDWVKAHMPILNRIRLQFVQEQPFKGLKVTICLHIEAKTAYLAKVIQAGGAEVTLTHSNPLSTQDDVCAALVEDGITVFAKHNPSPAEFKQLQRNAIESGPDLIIDDGGDLVTILASERTDLASSVRGGAEETTTGIVRLNALAKEQKLPFPMVSVNDALCKYLFDNRYGTGQSTFDGIMRTTNLVISGKKVVVAGYGWCGKGVAMRAKGLGASIIVTEVDPIKAMEAFMDGFEVMPMIEAAKQGDFFITATGNKNIIVGEHYDVMKDGAVLCNVGHFDVEVSIPDLVERAESVRKVRTNVREYCFNDGRKVYLLAEGLLVNLAAADGHPVEIMDMTFALQALGLKYVNEQYKHLSNSVISVPEEVDQLVASYKLDSVGVTIDTLSKEQIKYLNSWNE